MYTNNIYNIIISAISTISLLSTTSVCPAARRHPGLWRRGRDQRVQIHHEQARGDENWGMRSVRRFEEIKTLLNNFMKFWCILPEYFFYFLYLQGITLKGERALPPWLNMQKVSPFGTDTNTTREWTTSAENYYYNQKNHQLFLYPNIIFPFLFSRLHSGTDLSELAVSL